MRRHCSRRRAVLASGPLVLVLASVDTSARTAYAGAPLRGYELPGRHRVRPVHGGPHYIGTPSGGDPLPYVGVVLYTHPQPGTGCAAKGYSFDDATLGVGGPFSTTAYFSDVSRQLTFTVTGTFASAGSVHGTVSGNYGCGTNSFSINLRPAPRSRHLPAPCWPRYVQ